MDVNRFLQECQSDGGYRGQLVHVRHLPPRPARYGHLQDPLPPKVVQALAGSGVGELFTHQVAAVEALRRGENIVVVTGTASGKTLCYNVPVLEAMAQDPSVHALYLFPTKALAQDQLRALAKLGVPALGPRERQRGGRRMAHLPNSSQQALPGMADAFWPPAGTYDGDTPKVLRSRMRSEAGIVLSNPDMVHAGMLPSHGSWSTFLAGLRYVVIDELHACRGVFGSHTANVIRRLRRICRNYGSSPQFICCSATIANPVEHAEA
ncbi:MAG: DEAD/DEAH box helicase, partial [Acidobacteriota bacterium]|nr:DEAD/DEAH box helicase [Acidobacteriota bacterium]